VLLLGIIVGVVSVLLAAWQVRLGRTTFVEEQRAEADQRERRRATLLSALQAEVQVVSSAADADLNDFKGHNLSHPRVTQTSTARSVEGEVRYWFSFAWTPLPHDAVDQAIREASLLNLTAQQITRLQTLRLRILRVNALAQYKANLYPALMLADIPRHQPRISADRPWAEDKAAVLNNAAEAEVSAILNECGEIAKWWGGQ